MSIFNIAAKRKKLFIFFANAYALVEEPNIAPMRPPARFSRACSQIMEILTLNLQFQAFKILTP